MNKLLNHVWMTQQSGRSSTFLVNGFPYVPPPSFFHTMNDDDDNSLRPPPPRRCAVNRKFNHRITTRHLHKTNVRGFLNLSFRLAIPLRFGIPLEGHLVALTKFEFNFLGSKTDPLARRRCQSPFNAWPQ